MEFIKQDERIYCAMEDIYVASTNGNSCKSVQFRIAPENVRLKDGDYRVDMRTIGPWESADNGRSFKTLDAAVAFAGKVVEAMKQQKTFHPKGV